MTKREYIHSLQKKLKQINQVIDFKILHGLKYHEEARRHKEILARIKKQRENTLFTNLTHLQGSLLSVFF